MNFIKQHPVFIGFSLLVLVLVGVTANKWITSRPQGQGGWGSDATIVVTEPARIQTITNQIEAIGTARANESVVLTAKVTDTVSNVNFTDGMYVEAGAILVELTNAEETALLNEAKANVEETTRQFNRVRNLIQQKLASETQLDVEQARMQTAEARLAGIVARLDDRLITAPFSGVLGLRNISPGTLLTPTTSITTLDDISVIKLDFDVPETSLASLRTGQRVVAHSAAWPDQAFEGTVGTIDSRIDPVTRTVTVRALINNPEQALRPGMLLTVNLIIDTREALVVPEAAIIPIQERQFVYTVNAEGTVEQIAIEVGARQPGIVEVVRGLEAGTPVITQGVIKVRPGSRVTVRSEDTSS